MQSDAGCKFFEMVRDMSMWCIFSDLCRDVGVNSMQTTSPFPSPLNLSVFWKVRMYFWQLYTTCLHEEIQHTPTMLTCPSKKSHIWNVSYYRAGNVFDFLGSFNERLGWYGSTLERMEQTIHWKLDRCFPTYGVASSSGIKLQRCENSIRLCATPLFSLFMM